jgi:isopenicillin-N epimerase
VTSDPTPTQWPGAEKLRQYWSLDPAWTYLNHGGYGACPIPVLAAQRRWQDQLERQPIQFLTELAPNYLRNLREALGPFLGSHPENLGLVVNATEGINTVLRSLHFRPGDEIAFANHTYPSVRFAARFVADRWGARVVEFDLPFPITGPQAAADAVDRALTERTRLLIIDHITSPTGVILPLRDIIDRATAKDIPVLVDGAHAPGMLSLDLEHLGAAYYTGNCHKWMCAPKGAAFLWVAPEHQATIRPLTISLGPMFIGPELTQFRAEFEYQGTRDPGAHLAITDAIDFFDQLPGGWRATREHNHRLLLDACDLISEQTGVRRGAPDEMLGSLATFVLPDGRADLLQNRLRHEFRIEIPIIAWPFRARDEAGPRWLRISAQVYNEIGQYRYLANCLRRCLDDE